MTTAELVSHTHALLDQVDQQRSSAVRWNDAQVLDALNIAQRVFAFFTLCIERDTAFLLNSGATWLTPQDQPGMSDYIAPVRLYSDAGRLLARTAGDLHCLNPAWRVTFGIPTMYTHQGGNLIGLYPTPNATQNFRIRYAASPVALTLFNSPEIPVEYHLSLCEMACLVRLAGDGGQIFERQMQARMPLFQDAIKSCADQVRSRNIGGRSDVLPIERKRVDWSKILRTVKPSYGERNYEPSVTFAGAPGERRG